MMKTTKGISIFGLSLFAAGVVFAATYEYDIDKAHTRVGFSAKHMVISTVRGEFTDYSATIRIDEEDITNSSLEGKINVKSIDTGNEKRDNHLRSSDFFNADEFPHILFKSKNITKDGTNYIMHGDLTIRGITKSVEIPFSIVGKLKDPRGNHRIGIEAELTINRRDFGILWNKTLDNGGLIVSNDIEIELLFEGVRKTKTAAE